MSICEKQLFNGLRHKQTQVKTPVLPRPYEWEERYISSSNTIQTESGIFHYEMVLIGTKNKTESRVKVCPVKVYYQNELVNFGFINPVDKIAYNKERDVSIEWRDIKFEHPVPTLRADIELAKNHHICLLEQFIEHIYYPEILVHLSVKPQTIPLGIV